MLAAFLVGAVASVAAVANGNLARGEARAAKLAQDAEAKALKSAALAHKSRLDALKSAARYAARTLGEEIGQLWLVLQSRAPDPELRDALVEALKSGETGKDDALQAWVEARSDEYDGVIDVASWTVTDRLGWQRARAPLGESIGKNYAWRAYFHGGPADRSDADPPPPPSRLPVRSPVYQSQATGLYSVTFTAPIWEGEPGASEVLGRLGLTVQIDHFRALEDADRADQVTALLNLPPEGTAAPLNGLVLHHPVLASGSDLGAEARVEVKLPPAQAEALRLMLVEKPGDAGDLATGFSDSERHRPQEIRSSTEYLDPAADLDRTKYASRWLAALVPVRAPQPDPKTGDLVESETGWVVVVQGRPIEED